MIAIALAVTLTAQAVVEDRPPGALDWLARHQLEDGSWGGRPKDCT